MPLSGVPSQETSPPSFWGWGNSGAPAKSLAHRGIASKWIPTLSESKASGCGFIPFCFLFILFDTRVLGLFYPHLFCTDHSDQRFVFSGQPWLHPGGHCNEKAVSPRQRRLQVIKGTEAEHG